MDRDQEREKQRERERERERERWWMERAVVMGVKEKNKLIKERKCERTECS